jgi:hypothetical protein
MSIAFVALGCISLFTHAVELSIWTGVGGCLCPSSSNVVRIGTAILALINSPPSSASAANDITALIIFATVCTALLSRGSFSSSLKKKCPPVWLRALGSLRYDALL